MAVLNEFCATVAGDFEVQDILAQLSRAAVRVLGVDGAGVMVPRDDGLVRSASALVGPVEQVEGLQELLQVGPCLDSHRQGRVVNVADLAVEGGWPAYQRSAVEGGLRAVTAVPLLARGRGWGVLDLYRAVPRRLDAEELAAAQTLANLATSYLVVAADRDAARRAQDQLAHRAMHDPLTSLPVRWVFLEQVAHALARLARHAGRVGVLFLDLDHLKYVNDTYGHSAGDDLLRGCVGRVRGAVRPSDVLARMGGDEFVVLLEDVDGQDVLEGVAGRVLDALAAPYRLNGHVLQPSASIGLAVTADPRQTPDTLIAHADAAMYLAKRGGGRRVQMFDAAAYQSGRDAAAERDHRAVELTQALRDGQLELHYQPIIELAGPSSGGLHEQRDAGKAVGGVYAVEALARWRHPRQGLLTAADFIADTERAGLIVELGRWVLRTACTQLAAWDRELQDRAPARVFVNLSVTELVHPDLLAAVAGALSASRVAPGRLTLEVTETGLFTDPRAVHHAVTALREMGCELAIDDFGAGYSSLSRLEQVPAAVLKIDGAFARQLTDSPAATAIVSAVLLLGRSLHRTVIVEGVQDAATLRKLTDLGCTHVQGFYLGAPQPPNHLERADAPAGPATAH